jgi:hypothetical protein
MDGHGDRYSTGLVPSEPYTPFADPHRPEGAEVRS